MKTWFLIILKIQDYSAQYSIHDHQTQSADCIVCKPFESAENSAAAGSATPPTTK